MLQDLLRCGAKVPRKAFTNTELAGGFFGSIPCKFRLVTDIRSRLREGGREGFGGGVEKKKKELKTLRLRLSSRQAGATCQLLAEPDCARCRAVAMATARPVSYGRRLGDALGGASQMSPSGEWKWRGGCIPACLCLPPPPPLFFFFECLDSN